MNASDTPVSWTSDSPPVAVFSMKQAAQVAGISVSTLRRRRAELESAGAVISSEGWKVPITALEALGLMEASPPKAYRTAEPAPQENPSVLQQSEELVQLRDQVLRLQDESRELRHRAELAEAIARERAEALNAERMALRMITAGSSSSASSVESTEPQAPSTPHKTPEATSFSRGSWWKRTFG